jgi:hypothetical protein
VLRLDAINLATGEPRLLIERSGSLLELELGWAHISPCLRDNRLYWIDGNTNELVVHDPETGQEQRIPTIDPPSE